MENGNYRGRIAVDPQIHFGKPCVAGTRIPVVDVLELVREGISFKTIRSDYFPDLQEDDIRACIHYAIRRGAGRRYSYFRGEIGYRCHSPSIYHHVNA